MLSYLVRRTLYGALILLGVNLLTFFLFFTVNTPDDMARLNIGGKHITQDLIDKWKIQRGYDKPLYVNDARQGSERFTDTIFWERSVSLFELRFGRSDAESAGDIGPEVRRRMGVSIQLALPLFALQVLASTAFALLLVMFRHTRLDFWGVVTCVLMLSISSLIYIIAGQVMFSRLLKVAPISGYVPGWDVAKFLLLPIVLSLLARLGTEARLYRAMFLEEISKDYVPGLDDPTNAADALTVLKATLPLWEHTGKAGSSDPAAWKSMADFMQAQGLIAGNVGDVTKAYSNDYLS